MVEARRVKLILEYDGTRYCGWQRQINALSIQQVLEQALERLIGERTVTTGSSRTDARVHALGLCAHFDTRSRIPGDKFSYALNTLLPPDIRVRDSSDAPPGFHARFGALGKLYRYQIHSGPHASALYRSQRAHVIYPLNIELMRRESRALIGEHDFRAFAAAGSIVRDTVRTIHSAELAQEGELVQLMIKGNGFLYNMVRIIAGTLIGVGSGKIGPGAFQRAIESGDRLQLGVTAPAHGLTLMRVYYEGDGEALGVNAKCM